jgi:hypothetical protein
MASPQTASLLKRVGARPAHTLTGRRSVQRAVAAAHPFPGAVRCRRKFLKYYPKGFNDEDYVALERDYKVAAHEQWEKLLDRSRFRSLLKKEAFQEIAAHAVRIEARTNLIFSFEKMALRDAIKSASGAKMFAAGLYDFLHGTGDMPTRFDRWCEVVTRLPRKQTRVSTWPIVTVFGFIAQPYTHVFLKPNVTRLAAKAYGFPFHYHSRPSWQTYEGLLQFADAIRRDLRDVRDLQPRDMIDIQSFIWVQGSDEYP